MVSGPGDSGPQLFERGGKGLEFLRFWMGDYFRLLEFLRGLLDMRLAFSEVDYCWQGLGLYILRGVPEGHQAGQK